MPSAWVNERKREYYYKKAKAEKFRSRASYKLIQAVTRHNFIKPGYVVVDIGAAPGGWTQAARQIVEDTGFVLAVDLKQIKPFDTSNVKCIIGDVTDTKTLKEIQALLPRSADVVISDVSPNISGIWELDHARQVDLATQSLRTATKILRPGGNFFVKVFQGDMLNMIIKEAKQYFSYVKLVKPKASRLKSAELYLLGINFRQKINQSYRNSTS